MRIKVYIWFQGKVTIILLFSYKSLHRFSAQIRKGKNITDVSICELKWNTENQRKLHVANPS